MSFESQLLGFAERTEKRLGNIVKRSAQTVFEAAAQTQPSVVFTGGSFVVGKVPVLTGLLVGSSELRINGSTVATGVVSGQSSSGPNFGVGLEGMAIGDPVEYVFTQPYGPAMEYGEGRISGRFFIREAVIQWKNIVEAGVTRED